MPEYNDLLLRVGREVDALWKKHGEYIAGKEGYQAIHIESVRMAHPAFPIFGCALATTPVLCNGARVNLWGRGTPSRQCAST